MSNNAPYSNAPNGSYNVSAKSGPAPSRGLAPVPPQQHKSSNPEGKYKQQITLFLFGSANMQHTVHIHSNSLLTF
jgi:hypothetical protein